MGTLLQFPKIHREEMLHQQQQAELIEAFIYQTKQLDLTFEKISELPPIPRNCFPVTQAALLLAEKRGKLPKPIAYNGKFCYSVLGMVKKALAEWIPFEFVGAGYQAFTIAYSVARYRAGAPRLLIQRCYLDRNSKAKFQKDYPEALNMLIRVVVMKATIAEYRKVIGGDPDEEMLRMAFPDVDAAMRAIVVNCAGSKGC